jgi:hypothetical protein
VAKQPNLNIFAKTEGPTEHHEQDNSDLDNGNIRSTGIGLREGEIDALDGIGAALGEVIGTEPIARNALMRIAVRRFIEAYRAGAITLGDLANYFDKPEKPSPRLKL